MAVVRPFRAITYARTGPDISSLTAPPYDVVSEDERAALLAGNPHNVIALELPEGTLDPEIPGNRYETGALRWRTWRGSGVLVDDEDRALWVVEQRFEVGRRPVRRRALVAEVGLEHFDAGVILPHERTLPKALDDRLEMIRSSGANLSQVFGLFHDPQAETGALFDVATSGEPVLRAVDADGVESLVWRLGDADVINGYTRFMADRQIFIADGHHRYTTALAYRDERRAATGTRLEGSEPPAYDGLMMALVNMDDPDLVVLPTHRVARATGVFDAAGFRAGLSSHFEIEDIPPGHPKGPGSERGRPAFIFRARGEEQPRIARLRADVALDDAIPLQRSLAWKELDVAVLQELVLGPLLGIHPDRAESLERLAFVKDPHAAMKMVGEWDVAFILEPTGMDQMRDVALAGETMPQKSTYFYPKFLSGLLFRSAL